MMIIVTTFFFGRQPPWTMASSFKRFLDHTQRRTKVRRTPLDEGSARRRDRYLTKHNTYNRQTSMTPVGFEPTISAGERPQTYALDRAATGTGNGTGYFLENQFLSQLRISVHFKKSKISSTHPQKSAIEPYTAPNQSSPELQTSQFYYPSIYTWVWQMYWKVDGTQSWSGRCPGEKNTYRIFNSDALSVQ